MPTPKATPIQASDATQAILQAILRRRNVPLWLVIRVQIIVQALAGHTNTHISQQLGVDRGAVRLWRDRWQAATDKREALEAEASSPQALEAFIVDSLRDEYRSGAPAKFSAQQVVQIVAIACEDPQASSYPVSHWTPKEIALEAIQRGIVESISPRQVGRFLK